MKRALQILLLISLVVVTSVASCLLGRTWMHRSMTADSHSGHAFIHTQLGITPEQDQRLHPIEARFKERRNALIGQLQAANRDLAQAILEDRTESVRANATVERIHAVQGELQKMTLAHIFEMQSVLTPEQYDRLLQLTAQRLASLDQEH